MPVSVSVHTVIFDSDSVLLIRRSDTGLWAVPGGRVEDNETFEKAAVREIMEECGITPDIIGICGIFSNPVWDRGIHSIIFKGTYNGKHEFNKNTEALETAFFNINQLPGDIAYWHKMYIESALNGRIIGNIKFDAESPQSILGKPVEYSGNIKTEDQTKLRERYIR
jgi:ADP-ribose pyrophosphatase YjhB (NUDIX family)